MVAPTWTLSGGIADMVGGTDVEALTGFVVSSETGLVDPDTGTLRVGSWKIPEFGSSNDWEVTDLPDTEAYLPNGSLLQVRAKFWDPVSREVLTYQSAWFPLTADLNLKDVPPGAPVVFSQEVYDSIIAARDATLAVGTTTDEQVESSLESRGLPTTGEDLSASTADSIKTGETDPEEAVRAVADVVARNLRAEVSSPFANEPDDSTPTQLSDGTPLSVFGNAPLIVADGSLTHVPIASLNSAGYGFGITPSGDRVNRIGVAVVWQSGQGGTLTLIVSPTMWSLPVSAHVAPFHLTIQPTGPYKMARWNGADINQVFAEGATRDMRDGKVRVVDCFRDPVDPATWHILMPEGPPVSVSHPLFASEAGPYFGLEWYEADGTGVTCGKILDAWVSSDEQSAAVSALDSIGPADLARSIAGASTAPGNRIWSPASTSTVTVPSGAGSVADVDTAGAWVQFQAPPSGKVELTASSWIELKNASATSTPIRYYQRFRIIAGARTGGGSQVETTASVKLKIGPTASGASVASGEVADRVRYGYEAGAITGLTPYATYTAFLQHYVDQKGADGTAFLVAGSSVASPCVIRAIPDGASSVN